MISTDASSMIRHAIIMPSSSCDFDRHIMLSSSKIHLVISTDTSCYHHLVSSTYTSSCYETIYECDRDIVMLSRMRCPLKHALSHDSHARPFHTTCTHAPFHTTRTHTPFTRLARTTFNTTDAMLFFYGNIVMLSSSCDLSDRHML